MNHEPVSMRTSVNSYHLAALPVGQKDLTNQHAASIDGGELEALQAQWVAHCFSKVLLD